MEDNKYTPLNEVEFKSLKDVIDGITTHVPTHHTNYIWNSFNAIRKENERQPCNCGSAGKHWARAVQGLKAWIKERE